MVDLSQVDVLYDAWHNPINFGYYGETTTNTGSGGGSSSDPGVPNPNADIDIAGNGSTIPLAIPNEESSDDAPPYQEIPVEFDGITKTLSVAIPLNEVEANDDGSYTINIGVSDTGDDVLDSALWVSNFTGTPFTASGLFLNEEVKTGDTYIAPPMSR